MTHQLWAKYPASAGITRWFLPSSDFGWETPSPLYPAPLFSQVVVDVIQLVVIYALLLKVRWKWGKIWTLICVCHAFINTPKIILEAKNVLITKESFSWLHFSSGWLLKQLGNTLLMTWKRIKGSACIEEFEVWSIQVNYKSVKNHDEKS